MKGSRILYRTVWKLGVAHREYFKYGYRGITDPEQASWLTVREAKQVRESWNRHGIKWYVLSRKETLVYAVMNT